MEAETFIEAISRGNYAKDDCFINRIYDFYSENLLRADKKCNVINRAVILKTSSKTEESVKEGSSIQDVMPFFEKNRLQLRVFDQFYKLVLKYDPPNRNHHNKAMYCLMVDGHIYTLNIDLDRISEHEQENECDDHYKPKVGESFQIKDDVEARKAKMINNIDDILEVVRQIGPVEKDEKCKPVGRVMTLIHKEDNLMTLLYKFIDAGYSPGINFETGRITVVKLEINSIFA